VKELYASKKKVEVDQAEWAMEKKNLEEEVKKLKGWRACCL